MTSFLRRCATSRARGGTTLASLRPQQTPGVMEGLRGAPSGSQRLCGLRPNWPSLKRRRPLPGRSDSSRFCFFMGTKKQNTPWNEPGHARMAPLGRRCSSTGWFPLLMLVSWSVNQFSIPIPSDQVLPRYPLRRRIQRLGRCRWDARLEACSATKHWRHAWEKQCRWAF